MPDIVRDILQDLYAVEPTLAQREAELVPIIQKLLATKPDAHLDPAFRENLRQQLVRRSATPFFTLFTMRKLSYALFGVLAVAVVGVGTYAYLNRSATNTPVATITSDAPRISITNRDAAAFGNFTSNPLATQSARQGEALGSGGSTKTTTDAAAPSSLIAPAVATVYEYMYKGDALTIPTASVLKRSNQFPSSTLDTVLKSANLGLIDLEKFSSLKVQQISLAEDRDQGYSVNVDLREGAISLYQNWERWAQPLRETIGNANTSATLTLPSDEQLIATANAFLDQYGIPRSAYGVPVVPKYFLGYGETTASVRMDFVQSVQVVYPLVVDGKAVVSENGYPMGLTVDIDLTLNRVVSVNNLTGLSYEASAYPIITDTATVLDVVKRGGMYGATSTDQNAKKVQVEVGTPTLGLYASRYQIDQTNTEYLIPALVFPITKVPQGEQLYRTAIVVPLVKDLLDQQVKIQPAVDVGSGTSSTPGSAGSTGAAEVAPDAR